MTICLGSLFRFDARVSSDPGNEILIRLPMVIEDALDDRDLEIQSISTLSLSSAKIGLPRHERLDYEANRSDNLTS